MSDWIELGHSPTPREEAWKKGPGERLARILRLSERIVESVPYRVSKRWLFYRLWQMGELSHYGERSEQKPKVAAYNGFKTLTSKAVHTGIWPPDYLTDDTRESVGGEGFYSVDDFWDTMRRAKCNLDKWANQSTYLMIGFEAAAMLDQFIYLTAPYQVRLWPFRGDPSNPYKARIAQKIDEVTETLDLPVVFLYYGDLDTKGKQIAETAFRHIRKWAQSDFEAYRVGLNAGDEVRFNLSDNPEKPESYQWEALEDSDAQMLIKGGIERFYSHGYAKQTQDLELDTTTQFRELIEFE